MRRPKLFAATAIFAVFLGVFVARHHHCVYDDAFIYLRYVRNVHAGCTLRWNCEEPPVEGFSSPLYLALLVAGSFLTTKLVLLTTIVSTAALLVACALAFDAAGSIAATFAVVALLALDHVVLLNAVIGMDSGLAAIFVLTTWMAVARRHPRAAALSGVVGVLARPELLVFAVLVPFFVRRRRVAAAAIVLVGLAAITAARWLVFHDVLPNTFWAKSGGTERHAVLGAEYLLGVFRALPVMALAPLALFERTERRAMTFLLAGSAIWLASFLRTGGDTFAYARLAFPLAPAMIAAAARGVVALARRWRLSSAVAILPLLAWAGWAAFDHHIPEQHGFANVTEWTLLGRYVAAKYPGQKLAAVPIGAIGYVTRQPLLDLVGLTDRATAHAGDTVPPELLTREWIGHERHDLARVEEFKPDVILSTKVRAEPWTSLADAKAGFYADLMILHAIKEGRLPYRIADAPIAPGVHALVYERTAP